MLKQSRHALTCLAKRYRAVLRRCRLRALVLACALTALPPLPAGANSGGEVGTGHWGYPAYIGSTTGSGGDVIIDSGFGGSVYGGYSESGNATGNTVTMTDGTVGTVFGGSGGRGATHNTVIISGGTVAGDVIGGESNIGGATHNTVIISGGTVGTVFGGIGKNATNNTVILSGAPTLNGTICGGLDANGMPEASGNRLILLTSGLTAPYIESFEQYAFHLPATVKPGDTGLTLTAGATDMAPGGKATFTAAMQGIAGNGPAVKVGDRFTFLGNAAGLDTSQLTLTVQRLADVRQGVTLTADLDVKTDATSIYAQVTDTRLNPQTKALSEGHVSGTALALQGADIAAGKGMEAAGQAVRASLAEGGKGVAAFGALSGGWSRYNTGSHIDVSGFSLLTGLAWGADSVLGQFTSSLFFEFGSATTGTYNSFSNAASVSGDGSTWYMGAGLLARMDFNDCGPGHFYAEASGRAGGLHNEYRNDDLRDGDGRRADFDTTTPYVSLHAGLGYIWNLTDALSLDLHAKYFWTWQDSADTDLSTGEALHFDAVNSHRLRLGGRLTYAVNEHISPYVGAAWEHEFDGTARATSLGYDLDAPSLKGDTSIGELGLSWTPSATTPLTIDLSVQGYTGVREGYTGSFMVKWEF